MPKTPDYPVPALEKGLDILESLAAASVPQSLAELAARLKRSSSELFRMLNCLERRGYIMRDPTSGKYSVSLKLFTLSHAHSPTDKLLQAARRPMLSFTESFRESCHLSVLEGDRLLVVAQQVSPEPVRISIEVGGTFDPVATASGRLLLAQLDASELNAFLQARKPDRGLDRTLSQSLRKIRDANVSSAESESVEGVRDLAVLVGDKPGGVTAALAVSRLLRRGERPDDTTLLRGLQLAAREITKTLGLL